MHINRLYIHLRIFTLLFFSLIAIQSTVKAQLSVELNGLGAIPFGAFAKNINRNGIFGLNGGVFYSPKNNEKIAFGIAFNHLPYDESSLSDIAIEQNMYIRQSFRTNAAMQAFESIIRLYLRKNKHIIKPYLDGVIGVNAFSGITKSEDAFFTGDTNNDGKIDKNDGKLDINGQGIITDVELSKASRSLNFRSFSPKIGIAAGTKIKLYKSLNADVMACYSIGYKTQYYDYGSEEIYNFSFGNYNGFKLVESIVPVLSLGLGLSYSF